MRSPALPFYPAGACLFCLPSPVDGCFYLSRNDVGARRRLMGDTTELLLVKRVRDLLECMGSLAVLVLGGGGSSRDWTVASLTGPILTRTWSNDNKDLSPFSRWIIAGNDTQHRTQSVVFRVTVWILSLYRKSKEKRNTKKTERKYIWWNKDEQEPED